MKSTNIIIAGLLGLATVAGNAIAEDSSFQDEAGFESAEKPRVHPKQRRQQAGMRMMEKLDLDQEQKALFQKGQAKMKRKAGKLQNRMRELNQERREAFRNGDFESLYELIDEQAEVRSKLAKLRLKAMQPFHESLSDDQLETMDKMLNKRTRHRRGKMGRRGGPKGKGPRKAPPGNPDSGWQE